MDNISAEDIKKAFVERLRSAEIPECLDDVDVRLREYIEHVRDNSVGENDVHNVDEVAACCKFIRMCNVYSFDLEHVQRFIKMYESFLFSGMKGRQRYPMTSIQVFLTAGIFLFVTEDDRRVVREAIAFIVRKFAKTTFCAALALDDFLFGDANGETHIVANAEAQAKIAYKEAYALAHQLDPDESRIRFTANTFNWKPGTGRESSVTAHTAGGKTKDGAFASLVIADEYGSASYTKGHSDMADALNVYESSMGPRRNPLTVITTTAGRVQEGPFEIKLRQAQQWMYDELNLSMNEKGPADWQFLLSLHPDEWECNDASFCLPRVHRKCNPHIGVTVQDDYYQQQWKKAQGDPEVYKETVTKLFNQFVSNSSRPWIEARQIRELQGVRRIDQLSASDGWKCFVGMDFSKGDDLCGITYLCIDNSLKHFFADCDAWVARDKMAKNPNAVLYEKWEREGWLHVCDGSVINEMVITERLNQLLPNITFFQFGYDPYDSKVYVNHLEAWLVGLGVNPADYLRGISQTHGSFNSATQMTQRLVEMKVIEFSPSPILPWEFGNAILSVGPYDCVKPEKSRPNGKVDNVICLVEAVKCLEEWIDKRKKR